MKNDDWVNKRDFEQGGAREEEAAFEKTKSLVLDLFMLPLGQGELLELGGRLTFLPLQDRIRRLRREYGIGCRHGRLTIPETFVMTPAAFGAMVGFLALRELNEALWKASEVWKVATAGFAEGLTISVDGFPIFNEDDLLRSHLFLGVFVLVFLERYYKHTLPALHVLALDALDSPRALDFLTGRVSAKFRLKRRYDGKDNERLLQALAREYGTEDHRKLRERVIPDIRVEVASLFPRIKAATRRGGLPGMLAWLHNPVSRALEKQYGEDGALRQESRDDTVDLETVIGELSAEVQFMAMNALPSGLAECRPHLTERQYQVLKRGLSGEVESQIAEELGITTDTVNGHRRALRKKLKQAQAKGLINI